MNLDELQSVRDRERQTDKLQQLRESFYADAGEFIQQLRTERERVADRVDDPFDAPEVNRLTDEINTAEQTVEAIYEKRVGKIVKAASFAAADLPAEADGMTTEEQELFDTLVSDIKQNRTHVLDVLAGETNADRQPGTETQETTPDTAGGETPPEPGPPEQEPEVSAADLMGATGESQQASQPARNTADQLPETPSETTPSQESHAPDPVADDGPPGTTPNDPATNLNTQSGQPETHSAEDTLSKQSQPASEYPVRKDGGTETTGGVPRTRVRITEGVDTFVGSDDRDYDLDRNDIVTLPETNAQLLLERDMAEPLE